ncbi:MAG: hypothetical protein IIA59_09675 [Candidatus Marinimicrobia bacterium]|nr:hypothetical protein [Candidatus Neomarinimicrobiota bacterium]
MRAASFYRHAAGIVVALYLAAGAAPAYGQDGWQDNGATVTLTDPTD